MSHTPNIGVSPRGYVYRIPEVEFPDRKERPVFPEKAVFNKGIEFIWQNYRASGSHNQFTSLFALVTEMTKLIGNLEDWLWVNYRHNSKLHGYRLQFLKDTLLFVQTGKREFSPNTWLSLIDEGVDDGEFDPETRTDLLSDIHIPTIDEFLSSWISQPNGIDDLFISAYILFGKAESND